jgi:hypothetical protein
VPVKPSNTEEEFFAREDAEKKRKLALEKAKQLEAQQREELKKLHWMRCPKCGMELSTVQFKGVEIDRCFQCGVTVFDAGELEKIGVQEKEGGLVKSLVRVFNK